MKNNIISKAVAGLALVSMVGYTVPVFAYTKDETVYAKLKENGEINLLIGGKTQLWCCLPR